jgi:hypothetical protein
MKIFLIIVGALMVLAGAGCTMGGSALAILVGGDGWIESDNGRIDTPTYALVSEVADIADEDPDGADFINDLDDFRFRFEAESTSGEKDVFIGVGRAGDVSQYLAGVEHDVVNDIEFDDLSIDKTLVNGDDEPQPPRDQEFWVASVSGSGRQELDWEVRSGSYRFVVMNADASRGVDVDAQFGLKIPYAMQIAIALIVAGVVVAILGVIIILLAVRSSPPRPAPEPEPPPTA